LVIIKKKSVNEEVNSKCLYRAHLIPLCIRLGVQGKYQKSRGLTARH
jgi:hypothetical protein